MTNKDKTAQTASLVLAVAQGGVVSGPRPSNEEIALLHTQQLSFIRRQEIFSHLNATPELWRQWICTQEAELTYDSDQKNPSASPINWRRFGTWLWRPIPIATICASLFLIVLWPSIQITLQTSTNVGPEINQHFTSTKLTNKTPQIRSIEAGVLAAFTQLSANEQSRIRAQFGVTIPLAPKHSGNMLPRELPAEFNFGVTTLHIYRLCHTDSLKKKTAENYLLEAKKILPKNTYSTACKLSENLLRETFR